MTELQNKRIEELLNSDTTNPFKKGVYNNFLINNNEPQFHKIGLLDIIRSLTVILKQDVILKSPIKYSLEAYIEVYNILFGEEMKLISYAPHFFSKEDLEEDNDRFYNETIAIDVEGKYRLCNYLVTPIDRGYDTIDELLAIHSSVGLA